MKKEISIPIEEYNALREVFNKASLILNRFGKAVEGFEDSIETLKPIPKESKSQKVNKYKNLITSGERVKKPEHLRK